MCNKMWSSKGGWKIISLPLPSLFFFSPSLFSLFLFRTTTSQRPQPQPPFGFLFWGRLELIPGGGLLCLSEFVQEMEGPPNRKQQSLLCVEMDAETYTALQTLWRGGIFAGSGKGRKTTRPHTHYCNTQQRSKLRERERQSLTALSSSSYSLCTAAIHRAYRTPKTPPPPLCLMMMLSKCFGTPRLISAQLDNNSGPCSAGPSHKPHEHTHFLLLAPVVVGKAMDRLRDWSEDARLQQPRNGGLRKSARARCTKLGAAYVTKTSTTANERTAARGKLLLGEGPFYSQLYQMRNLAKLCECGSGGSEHSFWAMPKIHTWNVCICMVMGIHCKVGGP